jgi:hypothetical protein
MSLLSWGGGGHATGWADPRPRNLTDCLKIKENEITQWTLFKGSREISYNKHTCNVRAVKFTENSEAIIWKTFLLTEKLKQSGQRG